MRSIQQELKQKLGNTKKQYRDSIEWDFRSRDTRRMWATMKVITNMTSSKKSLHSLDENKMANDLNIFYLRHDVHDFSVENDNILSNIITAEVPKIDISMGEVTRLFRTIKTNKATGPDGITALLLKTCADELSSAWVFQRSVDSHTVPSLWKTAIIIPVPKTSVPKENNDYRPVALTSNVMKCLEKLIVRELKSSTENYLDPYQFAYKNNRSTDDAVLTVLHSILQHLENPKAYARLLFIDFSSAFNTLLPHILLDKLINWSVNPYIIRWYHSFLSNRTQQVRVNQCLSDVKTINTGVPQSCVSSPVLFTLYSNDCTSSHANTSIIKFSDDTAILGLMDTNMDTTAYTSQFELFVQWCEDHSF